MVAEWKARGAAIQLVDMSTAGFDPDDYWVAGIHFNDNGWCKMARVWAAALMPTLPKRSVVKPSAPDHLKHQDVDGAGPFHSAAFARADPVPQTGACVIPGSTANSDIETAAAPTLSREHQSCRRSASRREAEVRA